MGETREESARVELAIDTQVAAGIRDFGGLELLEQLVTTLRICGSELVGQIGHGVSSRDFDEVQRAAHTLRGSAGTVGARQLPRLAARVEMLAREARLDLLDLLLPDLREHLADAAENLERFCLRSAAQSH